MTSAVIATHRPAGSQLTVALGVPGPGVRRLRMGEIAVRDAGRTSPNIPRRERSRLMTVSSWPHFVHLHSSSEPVPLTAYRRPHEGHASRCISCSFPEPLAPNSRRPGDVRRGRTPSSLAYLAGRSGRDKDFIEMHSVSRDRRTRRATARRSATLKQSLRLSGPRMGKPWATWPVRPASRRPR
jgi:hypothetical protein